MSVALATWPTARKDAFEEKWSKMMKRLYTSGVHATKASETGMFRVYADGQSGLTTKVATGEANLLGFHAESGSVQGLAHANADGTNDRIDRVILRVDMTSPVTIYLDVLTGVAQTTPEPPALTDSDTRFDLLLADVTIPHGANSLDEDNVTDKRTYVEPVVNVPIGCSIMFFGTVAPRGFLMHNGQTVNTADYPILAAVLGETGDTMVIDDMSDRVPRGANGNLRAIGGADAVTLGLTNMPPHSHTATQAAHNHSASQGPHDHSVGGTTANKIVFWAGGDQQNQLPWSGASNDYFNAAACTFSHVDAAQPAISVGSAQPAITVASAGGSGGNAQPFDIKPKYRAVNFILSAA